MRPLPSARSSAPRSRCSRPWSPPSLPSLALALAYAPVVATSAGCIRSAEGPDLGDCAVYQDGAYTFGEIGIGTCLAGPADVRFFEQDGSTWLAVSNADPYLEFMSGSVLIIDWASVDVTKPVNLVHELAANAQTTDRFNGQLGYLADREQLLVPNRLSEDAVTRTSDDQGFVIDVSDPTAPAKAAPQYVIPMQDDPYLVVVQESAGIAWVGNLTAHSITPFDTTTPQLEPIDTAPDSVIGPPLFSDADQSGSVADVDTLQLAVPEEVDPDLWTLTYVDKLARLWVPTPNAEGEAGLVRWTGDEDFVASGLGIELDPDDDPTITTVTDPFAFVDTSGLVRILFSDDGVIRSLLSTGAIGDWTAGDIADFSGSGDWDVLLGGPSVATLSTAQAALYYDGRAAPGEDASIGLAATEDGVTFLPTGDPILSTPGLSLEDPFVRLDDPTAAYRMWMSVFDGERWSIGLSDSADGLVWGDVVEVVGLDGLHVAAPNVSWVNGRYVMWYTTGDADGWAHTTAWSYDGEVWYDPTEIVASEVAFDLSAPPRMASQVDTTNGWRLEGRDEGVISPLVPAGQLWPIIGQGMVLEISSGQEVRNDILPDNRSAGGILPASVASVAGFPTTLFVTAIGLDSRSRLAAIAPVGDSWAYLESDLVPAGEGGNVAGVSNPVVTPLADGTYAMFYAAVDNEGVATIRRATSDDGRDYTPSPGLVVTTEDDWDDVRQEPHTLEILEDGSVRLWYAGFDGSRWAIGALTAASPLGAFTPELGAFDPWIFGTGTPGSFDDSGVKDPMVFVEDGVTQMYYSGFDGVNWHLGHAVLEDGEWIRRADPANEQSVAAMGGIPGTFSSQGVADPVLATLADGTTVLWYSGWNGVRYHLGEGLPRGPIVFPAPRFPTSGDFVTFEIDPGGPTQTNIELEQTVAEFATSGIGMSAMTLDEERGFLYIPSKLANFLYVIDVRDDTSGLLDDANYLDVEELVSVESDYTALGFRDVLVDPIRDRLYATSRDPDGVVVLDLNDLVDDDAKDVESRAAMGVLPLLDQAEDAGVPTAAAIGGSGMALTPDGQTLLVTHLRGNALWAFDLSLGAYGEPVAVLQNIGENPHQVRISPDGRYAVVANYLGDVDSDSTASSTLAVVDIDPASETYLEIVTWIANR